MNRPINRPLSEGSAFASRRFFSASERMLPLVARVLLGTWLMPMLFAACAVFSISQPASAQAQPQPQNLVILDFDVAPGIDPVLGRKAADALAVELKASANYEVVPRSRVEQVVANEPGLRAPFTPQTQVRLAQRTGASGVISGRVVSATMVNRKSARVTVEARQLDASTGDIVNGAQISETTLDKLQEVDNDILLDEAINKVSFAIVRAMSNTRLPEGTILNTTNQDVELSLGARDGVAAGQRYSVLRDVQNRATGVVERVKVAEVTVNRVEGDQATAAVTAGGDVGVKTGDKIRQIFVPRAAAYPVSASGATDSLQLPSPPRQSKNPLGKATKGLGGLAALALAVGLAGFGGGSKGSRADTSPPTGVTATPIYSSTGANALPSIQVNYSSGLPGIIGGENILGYFIYRGTTPGFAPSIQNLNDFVQGRGTSVTDQTSNDPDNILNLQGIRVQIRSQNQGGDNGGGNGSGGLTDPTVNVTFFNPLTPPTNANNPGNNNGQNVELIDFIFLKEPALPGQQYFYKVQRVTAITTLPSDEVNNNDGDDGNNGGDDENSGNGERRVARLSDFSSSSGGATAPLRPTISDVSSDLNNFSVTLQLGSPTDAPAGGVNDIDEVLVQVRVPSQGGTAANPGAGNFVQRTFLFPGGLGSQLNAQGQVTLNFDSGIFIPNFNTGDEILVRVGIRNSTDQPGPSGGFVFARGNVGSSNNNFEFRVSDASASTFKASRFVPQGGSGQRRVGGAGLPGSSRGGIGRLGGSRRTPGAILRPR
ncbi:MAG TPA: hypothetical protein VF681_01245 [Abditibacteriaceae bacterium]